MRFAASSTDDQRSLVRVAPRVFLIRDGKLLDRHRQGEQRRRSTRQAFQLGPLKLRVNGLEPAIFPLLGHAALGKRRDARLTTRWLQPARTRMLEESGLMSRPD